MFLKSYTRYCLTRNSDISDISIGFFLIATPLFFMPPPGWHKRGGIRISGGGIKGGGIKISDFQVVA